MSVVRDMSLAEHGRMKIRWVQDFMPALSAIRARTHGTRQNARVC